MLTFNSGDIKEMARSRNITEVKKVGDIEFATVTASMKDGDKEVPIIYDVPNSPADFKRWVASLPDAVYDQKEEEWTGELHDVHQAFWSGYDLKLRADKREASVLESTIIKVDKKDVDLMLLPIEKAVLAINGVFAVSAATGKEPQNAFVVTRRKLIEAGTAKDQNGVLVKA